MSLCRTEKIQVWIRDKRKCVYCKEKIGLTEFTIDHVKPISKGGTDDKKNVVCSCFSCNQLKSDMLLTNTVFDWVFKRVNSVDMPAYSVAKKIRKYEKEEIL